MNTLPATPTVTSPTICDGQTATITTPSGTYTYTWTVPTGVAAPGNVNSFTTTKAGTYSLTITNNNSCISDVGTGIVKVNPIPAKPTIASNSPICEGASLNLTTTNIAGATYSWTGANNYTSITVNPVLNNATSLVAGNYSLIVTINGCASSASTPITVIINPTPAAPTLNSNSPLEIGATLNLNASTIPGATYAWTGPNGYTSTQQNPSINSATTIMSGNYFATVSLNGCTSLNSSPLVVIVNPASAPYFQIPNAFVPGSTNEFDNKFRIFSNSSFPSNLLSSFRIFSRNGQLIKIFTDITDSWDGKGSDGSLLESDVYLWVASFVDDPLTKKIPRSGTFILLK